jgi:lambda repressor-like predicted transcriptional regulator
MQLPDSVVSDLQTIYRNWDSRHLLGIYCGCLAKEGWSLTSIAKALGLSRERVRQIAIREDYSEQSLDEYKVITGLQLPVPPAPFIIIRDPGPRGKPQRPAKPETLERLRELHKTAIRYRGGKMHAESARLYTELLWKAVTEEGASMMRLSLDLDLSPSNIQHRLVRYGYKETKGTSYSLLLNKQMR